MSSTILIIAVALGILPPILFIFTLTKGIQNSSLDVIRKSQSKTIFVGATFVWTLLIWVLALAGVLGYHSGDMIPRFILPLMLPVFAGIAILRSSDFRIILDHTPLPLIVGMQTFRLLGVLFILVVNAGLAPRDFITGGYGDILTGSLALVAGRMLSRNSNSAKLFTWLFTIAGLFDLLNVAYLLLRYYPIWNDSQPSSAAAADFPLVLVLGLAAPVALLCHFYVVRALILTGRLSGSTN